ncbi:MAG: peptide chain release factor N(5)-glutamine methyltransferase [Planctomycetaceae bacterium]|nr:peptide chain release factor N(5)-glutamine methyltransferase [Planctomycetaceae bacterium]
MSESWTVLRLLSWTTDYLKQHGSDSPRLDAEVLLAGAKGCERIMLYTAFDEVVSEEVRAKFRELVKQRASGMPVAYLVGQREFYSLRLRVTPDVLIPRPETEFVVIAALDHLKRPAGQEPGARSQEPGGANTTHHSPLTTHSLLVADVGTGSGAIAIAIARHAPNCRVTAIDNSSAALAIARDNAARHQVADRIEFALGDLLAPIPAELRFAVIASNPPYVTESEYAALAPQVKDHEPKLALVAGPKGTETIERLIPQAAERLLPGGLAVLEVSPMIAARVAELFAADGRFEPATIVKDLAQRPRVVQSIRKS